MAFEKIFDIPTPHYGVIIKFKFTTIGNISKS